MFILAIVNAAIDASFVQSFQRAEVIACISSIIIIGIGLMYQRVVPNNMPKSKLTGEQGIYISEKLHLSVKQELAWGSELILTATPAATILIFWRDDILLKRGLITDKDFKPGNICKDALEKQRLISLANTNNYPDTYEFDNIIPNIPALIVQPIGKNGFIVVGGWTIRCFSKSDELWIAGWSKKLNQLIDLSTNY